jgi:nucleoside-diphosphate-sugar epimerase
MSIIATVTGPFAAQHASAVARRLAEAYPDVRGVGRAVVDEDRANIVADEHDPTNLDRLRAWAAGFIRCMEIVVHEGRPL